MIEFLLICVLIAQILTIIGIWATRTNDFSKEDSKLEKATEDAKSELQKISQKN